MAKLIKDHQVVDNPWQRLPQTDDPAGVAVPAGPVLVPLAVWQAQRDSLCQRDDVGLWLESDQLADPVADDLAQFPVVAVNFPVFADGRGFSIGRLLRERHGYQGELRAVGNVLRDQLHYLARCGFNAFELRDGLDPEASLASLNDFTEHYQAALIQAKPLFARR